MTKNKSRRAIIKGGLALLGSSVLRPPFGAIAQANLAKLESQSDDLVEYMWSGGLTHSSIQINIKLRAGGVTRLQIEDQYGTVQKSNEVDLRNAKSSHIDHIVTFSISNLQPETDYIYQAFVDEVAVPELGRFSTPGIGTFSFKVALGNCAQTASNSTVF
ncbi:MAG: hypothetical protein AAGD96_35830, partial [Chloroflexota bacterium]